MKARHGRPCACGETEKCPCGFGLGEGRCIACECSCSDECAPGGPKTCEGCWRDFGDSVDAAMRGEGSTSDDSGPYLPPPPCDFNLN